MHADALSNEADESEWGRRMDAVTKMARLQTEVSRLDEDLITQGVRALSQLSPLIRASLGRRSVRHHADAPLR